MKPIVALIGFAALTTSVVAQQNYAFRKTDIRAAYFHVPGDAIFNAGVSTVAPHIWFNLDSNKAVKPAGWNFTNPLAPTILDTAGFNFYTTIFGAGNVPAVGTANNKRTAPYWWVNLADFTDEDVSQVDVGILQVNRTTVGINPEYRERLRKFVDKGGVLWVDIMDQGNLDQSNGAPFPFRTFIPGTPNGNVRWDTQNPLLRYPSTLSSGDIQNLTIGPNYLTNRRSIASVDLGIEGANAVEPLMYSIVGNLGEGGRLRSVASAGGAPTIMSGRIGDGYVVVTSRGVSEMLNRVGTSVNRGFYAVEPNGRTGTSTIADAYASAAAKFLINVVSLAADSTHSGAGSRRNFGSFVDVGAPLLQTWSGGYATGGLPFGGTMGSLITQPKPPVIYKGMAFVASDNNVIVYDTDPKVDRDGDGNPDDGFQDSSLGEDHDIIFATQNVGNGISSAVCVEVPDAATGVPIDQLLVVDGTGRLLVYPIFDNTRRLPVSLVVTPIASITPSAGQLAPGEVPKAPTVHEGVAYVVDSIQNAGNYLGRIWQANLRTLSVVASNVGGGNPFIFGGSVVPIQNISGPATVGYTPILDNSGGSDRIAYLPLAPNVSPVSNAGMMSVWIGSRGEKPFAVEGSASSVIITTRAANQGGLPVYVGTGPDPLSVKVSLIHLSTGQPFTAAELAGIFTGSVSQSQGTVTLGLISPTWPPADVDPDNGVRIDYTIDWGAASPTVIASVERGRLLFPGTSLRKVVDGLALSPSGTVYATVSTQRPSAGVNASVNDYLGSLFAIREEGRGNFRMVYRWDLYPQHTFTYNGGSATLPGVLPDNDPVQYLTFGAINLNTFLGGSFRAACFQGAPVIRNGEVYVTVSGQKAVAGASAILCFKDETSAREIRLGRSIPDNAVLLQPDMARSANPLAPTTMSILPGTSFRVEREAGEIGGLIRIDNMMNGQRGQIVDSLSTSQPVILRVQGQSDLLIDPNAQGDRWSPLKWYTILHGTDIRSTALATGSSLYVAGSSVLPDALDGKFPPSSTGFLSALRTDFDVAAARRASQSINMSPINFDPVEIVADDLRPYMRQVISMDYPRATNFWNSTQLSLDQIRGSQIYLWPQTPRSSTDQQFMTFDDFRIRVNQCALRRDAGFGSYGVVGGEGTLITWNQNRVYGFRRANTWVADEGRILQVDPSGNVLFDSSVNTSTGSSAGNTEGAKFVRFARPTKIYPIGNSGDVLVVDSDKNRIVRMTGAGTLSRELSEFALDTTFVPKGYRSGDSKTFDNPRDVVQFTTEVVAANNPFTAPRALEYWVNYIVADQGNNRIVHLVDRWELDATTGNFVSRISEASLFWHSPASASGNGFAYNSLSRVQTGPGAFMVVAGVGGKSPTRIDVGDAANSIGEQGSSDKRSDKTGNGGVVIFSDQFPDGFRVFSQIATPAVDHTRRWDFATGNWSTDATADVLLKDPGAGTGKYLPNLQSVTARLVPNATPGGLAEVAIMITDGTGVYEVSAPILNPTVLTTRWMLPNWAFRSMRRIGNNGGVPTADNPKYFSPTYARRIDDDNVMIVNGYQGETIGLPVRNYLGEVLQVDGRIDTGSGSNQGLNFESVGFSRFVINLGFNTRSIKLRFGPIEGTRGLVLPVFADRR